MPHFDAYLFNKKGEKKVIRVILDEGDSILGSIKQAMKDHNVNDVRVEDMHGLVKEITVNYMEGHSYKSKIFRDTPVIMASGNFKLSYGELFGSLHVSLGEKRPFTATLVKGTGKEGLEIKLSYVHINE